jgi:hypothetical protein
MQGVRINNLSQENPAKRVLDYDFSMIIDATRERIGGLYWVLDDVNFVHVARDGSEFVEYQNDYAKLIIEDNGLCKLSMVDFTLKYAKFVRGDNDRIIGIRSVEIFRGAAEFGVGFVETSAVVLFSCVDALFWEVYSIEESLLSDIRSRFRNSEPCVLSDRW